MKRHHYFIISFLLILSICMGSRCKKEITFTHTFRDKIDLYPSQKIYNLGDTITLQYNNPSREFFDTKTNQIVRVDSSKISFTNAYFPLYNATPDSTGNYRRYIIEDNSAFMSQTACSNDSSGLHFKIKIVPTRVGIYAISLYPESFIQNCDYYSSTQTNASIDFTFNVPDCNKDIYLSIPKDSIATSFEANIDNKIMFVLEVR